MAEGSIALALLHDDREVYYFDRLVDGGADRRDFRIAAFDTVVVPGQSPDEAIASKLSHELDYDIPIGQYKYLGCIATVDEKVEVFKHHLWDVPSEQQFGRLYVASLNVLRGQMFGHWSTKMTAPTKAAVREYLRKGK